MPQIAQLMETYASQIFWLLVFFGIVYFVIGRGMVPKVMATVADRDSQIAADLAAAEAARAQADAEEEAWRQRENANRAAAQATVGKAKAEAAVANQKKLAAAQARIDARVAEAEAAIAAARTSALAEIEDVAVEAAQDIVHRLAGVKVTKPAAKSAVKEAMAHG
ncbi:ATPase [Altererythrobacter sp. H2]|uniref:F0F1 ATP synthase subunit B family protein n=1 Tax=Altererythrobacter sp. H2 TaxID=3108391 RepID=UPI002B4BEE7E|nr:ATPase [Altererythrobacter sp. H2]WRK97008.1 ATPase [Altererythrobacter sp. H2]